MARSRVEGVDCDRPDSFRAAESPSASVLVPPDPSTYPLTGRCRQLIAVPRDLRCRDLTSPADRHRGMRGLSYGTTSVE